MVYGLPNSFITSLAFSNNRYSPCSQNIINWNLPLIQPAQEEGSFIWQMFEPLLLVPFLLLAFLSHNLICRAGTVNCPLGLPIHHGTSLSPSNLGCISSTIHSAMSEGSTVCSCCAFHLQFSINIMTSISSSRAPSLV